MLDACDLLLWRFGQGIELGRQSLALLGVENRVFLEEWISSSVSWPSSAWSFLLKVLA
jgi:hypothetical protein